MTVKELSLQERVKTGCSHVAEIDYTDLTDTAGTTKTLELFGSGLARDIIDRVIVDLVTPFDGGATSALKLDVGVDVAAGTDDPDAFIDNLEIHLDATEILAAMNNVDAPTTTTVDGTYGAEESAALNETRAAVNNLRAKVFAAQEAYDLDALFTSTGANLTALDAGRVRIYFNLIRITDLRNINNE